MKTPIRKTTFSAATSGGRCATNSLSSLAKKLFRANFRRDAFNLTERETFEQGIEFPVSYAGKFISDELAAILFNNRRRARRISDGSGSTIRRFKCDVISTIS